MADGDADQTEVSTTTGAVAPSAPPDGAPPSDVQGGDPNAAPPSEPAREVSSAEPEAPAPVDPLDQVKADVEAMKGRLDLIEQDVQRRLTHISEKMDEELRAYLAMQTGHEPGQSIGERLSRMEAKLKHM